ncbi:MAG: 2-isopropylmalate synthase [Pelotomaculum sp.]|uniref:2-isopropylmalate synthase n=1 Tax=Pelotomaculum thermopropionicum (strain DSM 13744 / JCM 10971 / SI) TaxID=370438 RepID=LEU1_PELTS|nr:RecName: Full=2-isopropylmalate synthase; AltName: Full=Alpha-IPM synthase; AltName: Full=Alpha-isopropylmalate synthase [Pelotomaculum thermopropionicum SI]NPV73441.1 2-isopropylmalate synthase [Pelotomaculum sp.]BAF58712.1 isopropylmalate/homocitrate/citramalate synthases [Pelotomaculum thermopropionicum SI]
MSQRVYIFDTTLRDGEQSPGVSLNVGEKVQIARQLAKLGVDIIEAGFPITSPGDFKAVSEIARQVKGVTVAALARANFQDIDRAWEAVRHAEQPRIHTFIATSDIHLKYKLRMSREEVLDAAVAAVKRARAYTGDVEFSAEDASRSDLDFLCRVLAAAIEAGATVINIPDTVGYAVPEEWGKFINTIYHKVPGIEKVIVSVHCHNDLGMAVANSLAAVMNGARQVEGAINGIGERAGNAAIEEMVMALYTRKDQYNLYTNIKTEEIYRTSKLVSALTGMKVQPNKAVVGKNAFAHEAGIHQDGVLKERTTYEIMNPAMVGISKSNLVLGKHSGRHAFRHRLEEMGYNLSDEELNSAFERFKKLADKKMEITDEDLEAIIEEEMRLVPHTYTLEYLHISSGTTVVPTATVGLKRDGQLMEEAACGNGPVDAICKAIDKITGLNCTMTSWGINAVTAGKDALGDVSLKVTADGEKVYVGRGISTDVLEASAKAYVNAVNKLIWDSQK